MIMPIASTTNTASAVTQMVKKAHALLQVKNSLKFEVAIPAILQVSD